MSCSLIENVSNSVNNYCIYISSNNPEHCIQLNLLTPNITKKYKNINLYFLTSKRIINEFKLPNNFIDEDFFSLNRSKFGHIEGLQIIPKIDIIENYCNKNDIELCVNNEMPYSSGKHIVVYTQSHNHRKSLSELYLDKLKKIFGHTLCVDPENLTNAKYVLGPECCQIFESAAKKIPTYIITNNGNYAELFLKMFPKHKKLEL